MPAAISTDPLQIAASALFKRLIDSSDWTHETFGAEIDVSPGRISQWATNRGAIPAERAVAVAEKLGTEPELISPSWAALRDQFLASQPPRLDVSKLAGLIETVEAAIKNAERVKLKTPITVRMKARLIVNLYVDSGAKLPTAKAVAAELARIIKAESVTNDEPTAAR